MIRIKCAGWNNFNTVCTVLTREFAWKQIFGDSYSLCDSIWGCLAPISCLAGSTGPPILLTTTPFGQSFDGGMQFHCCTHQGWKKSLEIKLLVEIGYWDQTQTLPISQINHISRLIKTEKHLEPSTNQTSRRQGRLVISWRLLPLLLRVTGDCHTWLDLWIHSFHSYWRSGPGQGLKIIVHNSYIGASWMQWLRPHPDLAKFDDIRWHSYRQHNKKWSGLYSPSKPLKLRSRIRSGWKKAARPNITRVHATRSKHFTHRK